MHQFPERLELLLYGELVRECAITGAHAVHVFPRQLLFQLRDDVVRLKIYPFSKVYTIFRESFQSAVCLIQEEICYFYRIDFYSNSKNFRKNSCFIFQRRN